MVTESQNINATQMWCKLSNAIIRKYKPMTEENAQEAYEQLLKLEGVLLASGLFTQQEINEAL